MVHRNSLSNLALVAAIVASGACGSSETTEPPPPPPALRTFITTADFTGDIKGAGGLGNAIASADALCQADAGKPAGAATYKAMLVDGVNRVACTTAPCPGSEQADGTTPISRTNASAVFDFSAAGANVFGAGGRPYWTGFVGEGATQPWATVAVGLCGGSWASSADIGDFGSTDFTGWGAIGGGAQVCTARKRLVCVEQ